MHASFDKLPCLDPAKNKVLCCLCYKQTNKLKELNFKNTFAPMCSKYYARTQCYGRQPACFCIHHLRLQRQILCIFLVHLAQNFFLFFHIQSVPGNGFTPCKRLFTYLPTLCNRLMRTIRNLLETMVIICREKSNFSDKNTKNAF